MSVFRLTTAAAGVVLHCAAFAALVPLPAQSETIIGFPPFRPADAASDLASRQITDFVMTGLVEQFNRESADGPCSFSIQEQSALVERARAGEQVLEQQGHMPPGTAPQGQAPAADWRISGTVTSANGTISWTISVTGAATGRIVVEDRGSMAADDLFTAAPGIAKRIFSDLCPKKPWRLTARYNDLTLDGVICDITKPFTIRGTGETAGIIFSFTPADETHGSFIVGGTAGGVPWSGGGSYTVAPQGAGGSMPIIGSWEINTPVGVFGDSGTIPGRLEAAPDCKSEDQPTEKNSAKKKG